MSNFFPLKSLHTIQTFISTQKILHNLRPDEFQFWHYGVVAIQMQQSQVLHSRTGGVFDFGEEQDEIAHAQSYLKMDAVSSIGF